MSKVSGTILWLPTLSGNNDVALTGLSLKIMVDLMWLQPLSQSMPIFFDIVVFNPDLYCSLKQTGAI